MTTHFLSRDFSLADVPDSVSPHHRDNIEEALEQRQRSDDAFQEASDLRHELGGKPCGTDRRRLQAAWAKAHKQRDSFEAMVQNAMEELSDDYPYGFGDCA